MAKKGSDRNIETARAIERALEPQDDTITLSTGVVLRGKKANPLILVQVMAFPRPEPPMYYNEKMGREMENPDDPDYIERLQAWKVEYADRVVNAMIVMGTELVSSPKKLGRPEDGAWLQDYSLLGLPMHPKNNTWRYLMWIKSRAAADEEDLKKIQDVVGRLSGVRESTVKSAESFPGRDDSPG